MIVRKTLDPNKIVQIAWKRVTALALLSTLVSVTYIHYGYQPISIESLPASILAVALSILIGFRVNSAYERWWEARRIWGALVNDSRSIARQVLTFFTDSKANESSTELSTEKRKFIYRQIAFVHALKSHLRNQDVLAEVRPFLSEQELAFVQTHKNIPNALLLLHGQHLQQKLFSGHIEDFRHMQMDTKLSALTDSLGACERIKNTIFPRQYSVYTTLFVAFYNYLLPFVLISYCGWLTIPLTILIGFIFFALDTIARGIENPFENTFNDTPMSSISRTIEINLKQMLGEKDIPEPVKDINGFLY
jgi:ion channel-forming bestrophin family protein